MVVKPCDADNSVGVGLVRQLRDLPAAIEAAFAHSSQVLVEDYIELGREVRCGVIECGGELSVLPLEEYAVQPTATRSAGSRTSSPGILTGICDSSRKTLRTRGSSSRPTR